MTDTPRITLAQGNGGRLTKELIDTVFLRHFGQPEGRDGLDATALPLSPDLETVVTTDGFSVEPLEFPGGDIGSLAVHGTVNDLAVCGATPLFLTLGVMIEEGLPLDQLNRIVASLAMAARRAGVRIVAGDTKVLPIGHGGGLYLTTTGIGQRPPSVRMGMGQIETGDVILVSGPVGDHGISVMLAREAFELSGSVRSDSGSVVPLCLPIADFDGVRFLRDPTRGGLATVAHEIAQGCGLDLILSEADIPVRDAVRSVCEILGYDPYNLACEGRVVAVVAAEIAERVLSFWQSLPEGAGAARIGIVGDAGKAGGREVGGKVCLITALGGQRVLDPLEDDPLPRIC